VIKMKTPDRRTIRLLRSALQSSIGGDIYFDDQTRLQYSTAACIYRVFPTAIVMPRDGDDVCQTVRVAREMGIPVTARGAGAGLTGGCLGTGIIIDFSRYMNHILSIDVDNRSVIVEPGIVQNDLNRALARHGLFFPPDPSSYMYSTIGGMVGNNAAGPHSIKYGATLDYLQSVSAVCANAEELKFENDVRLNSVNGQLLNSLTVKLRSLLSDNNQYIQDNLPKTRKNSSGYRLDRLVDSDRLNMARLMAASEGTLGVFTGLKLAVKPAPEHAGMLLLMFDSVQAACEAVPVIAGMNPSMLEIMESTFIELVRKSAFDVGVPFVRNLEAILLIEFDSESSDQIAEKINQVETIFVGPGRPAIGSKRGVQIKERERLDKVRQAASPILNRYPAPFKPIKFIEDTVVPVKFLPEYIASLHVMFKKFDLRGLIYGHAGDGHIHINPLFNIYDSDLRDKMITIAETTNSLVKDLNGSLSGEHGDGFLRTPFLRDFFGPLYPVFESVKRLFDPDNILNPGKIIHDGPETFTDNLKITEHRQKRITETSLDDNKLFEHLFKCSNCGACRQYCPVFMASMDERMSPRSKANLLTRILSKRFPSENEVVSQDYRAILDHCIHCNTCLTECPSGVNIPLLMIIAKHVNNDNNGIHLKDRLLADTGIISSITKTVPGLSNKALKNKIVRHALERTMGLDKRAPLAEFSNADLSEIASNVSAGAGTSLAYFPGCTAESVDPWGEGAATLSVLSHHGFLPFIPKVKCCGIAFLSSGFLELAKSSMNDNIHILYELARGGMQIVYSSPSCGLALRHEYPTVLQSEMSQYVAQRVVDIHEFLVELLSNGNLDTRFMTRNMTIAVHQPCHSRALGTGEYPIRLLEMIPGLKIHVLQPLCCGMAGTHGLKKHTYQLSRQIGKRLFQEIDRIKPEYVVSSCGSCRVQIEAVTGIQTAHPLSVLAEAYNLTPLKTGILKQSCAYSPDH
jgi:FAD/FMN-containing dehydrogenase/Fe-S oxidoreductase